MASANVLMSGITKLSGSKPLLNITIEIAYDIMTIVMNAIMFVISSIGKRFSIPE